MTGVILVACYVSLFSFSDVGLNIYHLIFRHQCLHKLFSSGVLTHKPKQLLSTRYHLVLSQMSYKQPFCVLAQAEIIKETDQLICSALVHDFYLLELER